jgi:hypothetical protein
MSALDRLIEEAARGDAARRREESEAKRWEERWRKSCRDFDFERIALQKEIADLKRTIDDMETGGEPVRRRLAEAHAVVRDVVQNGDAVEHESWRQEAWVEVAGPLVTPPPTGWPLTIPNLVAMLRRTNGLDANGLLDFSHPKNAHMSKPVFPIRQTEPEPERPRGDGRTMLERIRDGR